MISRACPRSSLRLAFESEMDSSRKWSSNFILWHTVQWNNGGSVTFLRPLMLYAVHSKNQATRQPTSRSLSTNVKAIRWPGSARLAWNPTVRETSSQSRTFFKWQNPADNFAKDHANCNTVASNANRTFKHQFPKNSKIISIYFIVQRQHAHTAPSWHLMSVTKRRQNAHLQWADDLQKW